MVLALLLLPPLPLGGTATTVAAAAAANSNVAPPSPAILVGAHYFSGWYEEPADKYSHFHGFALDGTAVDNFFPYFPARVPLLGNLTTSEETIVREIAAADKALDFFDVLYYDTGDAATCGPNPDPNLDYCVDTALAFMLNSTKAWLGVKRLRFFISYSNDRDRQAPGRFVGPSGENAWNSLVKTWVRAMAHPRYLKINGRPVFKVLIPEVFFGVECGSNATLMGGRLQALRTAAEEAGVGSPIIGGGWHNPSIADNKNTCYGRACTHPWYTHPRGYLQYNSTTIEGHDLAGGAPPGSSLLQCEKSCNDTAGCVAFVRTSGASSQCTLKTVTAPGVHAVGSSTACVRVWPSPPAFPFDFTGTYASPVPMCGDSPCPQYQNAVGKVFPYTDTGDYQTAARTNHSNDSQPYLPNLIVSTLVSRTLCCVHHPLQPRLHNSKRWLFLHACTHSL